MKGVSTILPTGGNNAFHSVLARGDGSVWVWGDDNYGQLGLGYTPPELEEPEICCCDGGLCCCDILPPWNVVTSPQLLLEGGAAQTEVAELSAAGQRYQFDGFGRLSAIVARIEVDGVEGEVPLRTYSYDPWGRVAEIRDFNLSRPEAAPVVKSTTYDSFGRVSRVEYGFEAQATPVRPTSIEIISGQVGSTDLEVFESFEYRFDKNHNIVRKRHIVNGELIDGPSHNEVRNYSFDAVGRLVSSESSVKGTNLYGWDKAGNRRFVSTDGIVEWSDFNNLNQLAAKYHVDTGVTTQYFYDANGNQIREEAPGQIRTFAYNVCNRLTEVRAGATADSLTTINANIFRGDGQRISKLENGRHSNYVYQSGSVLYTTDGNHELINLHLKAPDGALITMVHADAEDSTFSTLTTDIRRSTSTVLDAQGKFTTGFRYTDFGETTKLAETDELIEVAYTGGIWDQSTGLVYLNARFYNPVDARFLTMDVARNGGDLRATLSLYGYCEGDPINKIDPTGEVAIPIKVAAGAAIAGATFYLEYWLGMRRWNWLTFSSHVAQAAVASAIGWGVATHIIRLKRVSAAALRSRSAARKINTPIRRMILRSRSSTTAAVNDIGRSSSRRQGETWPSAIRRKIGRQ